MGQQTCTLAEPPDREAPTPPTTGRLRTIRLARRSLVVCAAGVAVVLILALARPLLVREVPTFFDLGCFHLPVRDFYSHCLRAGEPFDWMPLMYTGIFITGEGEHGPYHPLHLLLYRFLPLDTAFALEVWLPFVLMFLGTLLFLRPHAGTAGGLFGALVYTFSANNVAHAIHPNYVAVLSHLPWLLWLAEQVAYQHGAVRWLAAVGMGLLSGSQLLLGHPQALSFSLLAESLFLVLLLAVAPGRLMTAAAWCTGKALGLAVGGVQLLATMALLQSSNRDTMDPYFGSCPPRWLVQYLAPNVLFRHRPEWTAEPAYFGAVPLLLALWWLTAGWWRSPSDRGSLPRTPAGWLPARALTVFALVLAVMTAWLALGEYGGLYRLQTRLPLVGQLRAPGRYLNLVGFAASVLASLALGRLATSPRTTQARAWRALLLPWLAVAGAVAAAVVLSSALAPDVRPCLDRRFVTGPAVATAAAVALTLSVRGRAVGLIILILVCGWDLWHFSLKNSAWGEKVWRETVSLAAWRDATPRPPGPDIGRILDLDIEANRQLLRGAALVNGYRGGIEPRKLLDYTRCPALRLAAAGWYHQASWGEVTPIAGLEPGSAGWYRVPGPLPRVRLVSRAVARADPGRDVSQIDLQTTALTGQPTDLDAGDVGTATLIQDRPGHLAVRTEAPGRRLLVISESYDTGWKGSMDGRPVPLQRVNGDFLGCVVTAGQHTVKLRFDPPCLRWGRALSLAGLAASAGLAGFCLWRLCRPSPAA
jgi:hypothetical protein